MTDKTIVQIYEIQEPSEAEKMIQEGIDHIGSVILSEEEWKQPVIRDTIQTIAGSSSKSSLIPLFNRAGTVFRVLDYYQPDIVHFCESLDGFAGPSDSNEVLLDLQRKVRERFPEIKIMRSIPIPESGRRKDFPVLKLACMFEPVSDFFLTDTLLGGGSETENKDQPVKGFVGITGQICDWERARTLVQNSRIPVILAGGLSPENVAGGMEQVKPAGVDSCTGTNQLDFHGSSVRFHKDIERVRCFVKTVRRMG